ncbi:hypothetical protein Mgra_00005186 [Meloidogyne graminicola]|uniref:Uncharacterized protein n=1 Tax=Meloidogyne graminicola TaxID=189291 RepID=A0A8S9ZQ24_9BILA|nr:hypothetical protein Mgra_00005186 [Meloidogyne graminicola]
MNLILFNSINFLLFCFINKFVFIKTQQVKNIVCANKGMFLKAYCLADYNCNSLKINKPKACIRGLCCTQTKIKKEMVNKRTSEDKGCLKNSFNVGIKCSSTKDCQIKANLNLKAPFSLLECSKQAGICCTNANYLKPLSKGKWCLNWGKSLGKECISNNDCKSTKRPKASCVDSQCCTRPREIINDKKEEDSSPQKSEEFERKKQDNSENEDNFADFEDLYSEEDEEDLEGDKTTEQSYEQENSDKQRNELIEGQQICRSKGFKYKNVRKCSKFITCGNDKIFQCISNHCCLKKIFFEEEEEKEEEFSNGRLPVAPFGFCLTNKKFNKFIGRLCNERTKCPKALDSNKKRLKIICLEGACCAAMHQVKNNWNEKGDTGNNKRRIDVREEEGWILPPKQKYNSFCFDGTPSNTQCISQKDCPNYSRQICENGICCLPNIDQKQCKKH